jgi:uncharacterized protein YgiM (DUF1202 family)
MRRQLFFTILLLLAATFVAGCSLEGEGIVREPIDLEQWPTPASPTPTVSPTPFPKATLVPTAVPTEAPLESPTPTPASDFSIIGGTTTDLVQQASALSGGLSPVAVMKTSAAETAIRQGPGTNYGTNTTVEQGELGAVLGQDSTGDWLYVLTITNVQGWIPKSDARILGSLDEAPVLPPNPLAAFQSQTAGTGSLAEAVASVDASTLSLPDLTPVATGRVSSDLVNLRQRPGADYQRLGTLPANTEVAIFGLNRDKQWALVASADLEAGWMTLDALDITGSLDNAPQYRTLAPVMANLPAPIIPIDQDTPAVVASGTTSGQVSATPPETSVNDRSKPALPPANTLAPVAEARMNAKTQLRSGPGESYGALAEATNDLAVEILAVNPERGWAVLRTVLSDYGWAPVGSFDISSGSLDNAPAVYTALVTSNNLPILSGPGIYFEDAGLVNRNELVSVLAINPGRSWVLIETASGVRGWIQLRLIENLTAVPDELPVVEVDPQAQSTAPAGPPVPAASEPPSGLLVFQKSSGGDIMRINADGTELQKVSAGIDPVLSPDGTQVAFTRWQGDVGTLWVANIDGSGERPVLGEMRKAKGPDWSPDGSQIVLNYQQGGQPENQEVCQSPDRGIPFGRAENIRVKTEDGKVVAICYTRLADPHWTLRVIDVTDGNFKDMYGGLYAFRPSWDPQADWRIVSDAGNGLLATDINSADFRQQLTSVIQDGSPAFSPDGRFIAVTTREQNGSNIYRLNANGSGRVQLTQTPLWEGIRPDEESRLWNNVAPAWSPDGSRIAFLTDRSGRWEIWVMNADGSDQRPLFSEEINNQLDINYDFVDERVLSWR